MCSRQFKHFSNIFLQLILFPNVAKIAPLNYLGLSWRSVTKKLAQSSPQSGQCSDSEEGLGLFKFFQWFAILSRNRSLFCVTSLTAWRWLHSSHSLYLITFSILAQITQKFYIIFLVIWRSFYSEDLVINSEDHFHSFNSSFHRNWFYIFYELYELPFLYCFNFY